MGVNWLGELEVIQITIKLHKKITYITELIHYTTFILQNRTLSEKNSIHFQINMSLSVEAL